VDVLLNSLAGEFIPKGLSVMAPYGRFLEIGIRDILNNMELGLRPFEKCLSFFSINLSEKLPGFTSLLRQVVRHFDNRDLTPLPFRAFPVEETARAFKTMARGKHTGKIVVSQRWQQSAAAAGEPGVKGNLNPAKGLLPHEGVDVFRRILATPPVLSTTGKPLSQLVVSTRDLTQRLKRNQPGGDLPTPDALDISPPPAVVQPRPCLDTPYSPPVNESQQTLTRIWQNYLGIEKIGIHDNFFELGATSLDLIQISTRLKETLNLDIPVVTLFTYSTIHSLTEYLSREKIPPGAAATNREMLEAVKKGRNRLKNQKQKRK
jgi:acyl carrier protein